MEKGKNKAKSIKLKENDIICPSCNSILTISDEIKSDEFIQCSKCEAIINNPFFYSGKFVICDNCGNNAELPKSIENELIIHCNVCNQDIINPHSDKYNPILCPYCYNEVHIPEEIMHEKYIQCPFCQNEFKNTLKSKRNTNTQNLNKTKFNQDLTSNNNNSTANKSTNFTENQNKWIIGIIIFIFVLIFGYAIDDTSLSSSNSLYRVNTTTYVATSKSSFDEMFRYINDDDIQALSTLINDGKIQLLSSGTKVYLINSHFSYCVVRRKGSPTKLWIVREYLTKE